MAKKKIAKPLAHKEQWRFQQCERAVDEFLERGVPAARCLREIRDQRYYRIRHSTFANYCESRFGLSSSFINRIISHDETVAIVSEANDRYDVLPTTYSQTMPLAKLLSKGGSEIIDCWAHVVLTAPPAKDGPHITGKHVKDTVDQWLAADGVGDYDPDESLPDPSNEINETIPMASVPLQVSEVAEVAVIADDTEIDDDTEPELTYREWAEETTRETMEDWNQRLEVFCRGLVRHALEQCPEGAWIDEARKEIAMEGVKNAAASFRLAAGKGGCPLCEPPGSGCETCRYTGFLPSAELRRVNTA